MGKPEAIGYYRVTEARTGQEMVFFVGYTWIQSLVTFYGRTVAIVMPEEFICSEDWNVVLERYDQARLEILAGVTE